MKRLLCCVVLAGCAPLQDGSSPPPPAPPDASQLALGDSIAPLGALRPRPAGAVHINDIAVSEGRAWLPAHQALYVVDVSIPQAPALLSEGGSQLYRVDVVDGLAAVSGRARGVRLVGFEDERMAPGAAFAEEGYVPGGVALLGEHLLVGTTGAGLEVRRLVDLERVASLDSLPNVVDVAVDADVAVAVDRDLGLVVLDVADPELPSVTGTIALPGSPQGVALQGSIAVVAASGSLVIVDVADPADPQLLIDLPTDGVASRVAVDGDLVVVANWFDTRIYDIADPSAPRLVGVEEAVDSSMSVALTDGVLYVGDWDWLRIFAVDATLGGPDVSAPAGVTVSGSGDLTAALLLANVGDRDLVATVACDDARIGPGDGVTIPADDRATIPLTVTTDAATWTAVCSIASNDPDEPIKEVLIQVNPEGLEVGDEAPDWTLPDLDGALYTLSATRGEVVLITLFSGL